MYKATHLPNSALCLLRTKKVKTKSLHFVSILSVRCSAAPLPSAASSSSAAPPPPAAAAAAALLNPTSSSSRSCRSTATVLAPVPPPPLRLLPPWPLPPPPAWLPWPEPGCRGQRQGLGRGRGQGRTINNINTRILTISIIKIFNLPPSFRKLKSICHHL